MRSTVLSFMLLLCSLAVHAQVSEVRLAFADDDFGPQFGGPKVLYWKGEMNMIDQEVHEKKLTSKGYKIVKENPTHLILLSTDHEKLDLCHSTVTIYDAKTGEVVYEKTKTKTANLLDLIESPPTGWVFCIRANDSAVKSLPKAKSLLSK